VGNRPIAAEKLYNIDVATVTVGYRVDKYYNIFNQMNDLVSKKMVPGLWADWDYDN
jgi:hypothetical protein